MAKLSVDSIFLYRKKSYMFCYKLWELIRMKCFYSIQILLFYINFLLFFCTLYWNFLYTETIWLIKCFKSFICPCFCLPYWMDGHSLIYRINRRSLHGFKELALNIYLLVFLYTCIWSASIAFITSKLIFKILLFVINHE